MKEQEPKPYQFPWYETEDGEPYIVVRTDDHQVMLCRENTAMFLYPEYPEADHIWIEMESNSDGTSSGIRIWREYVDRLGEGSFSRLCDEMFERGFEVDEDEEPSPLDREAYELTFNRPLEKDIGSIVLKSMTNFEQAWEYYSEEWS